MSAAIVANKCLAAAVAAAGVFNATTGQKGLLRKAFGQQLPGILSSLLLHLLLATMVAAMERKAGRFKLTPMEEEVEILGRRQEKSHR